MESVPLENFFEDRAINPRIMAALAIGDHVEAEKFIEHTNYRVRRMYAINAQWRKRLNRESNNDRDFILMFIRHWADAYRANPERYIEKSHKEKE